MVLVLEDMKYSQISALLQSLSNKGERVTKSDKKATRGRWQHAQSKSPPVKIWTGLSRPETEQGLCDLDTNVLVRAVRNGYAHMKADHSSRMLGVHCKHTMKATGAASTGQTEAEADTT